MHSDQPEAGADLPHEQPPNRVEILFAAQGCWQPMSEHVNHTITVAEFGILAAQAAGIEEIVEVFREDAEDPLANHLVLIEHLAAEFSLLHVSRRHAKIAVTVEFNGRDIKREYRSNATVERVIRWAISPDEFDLVGDPSDFQMKHENEVLPPDMHVGQVPHPHHAVKLSLVLKVKPQG